MASLSFRDRFYTPPVARAVTSPGAIVALGIGAAIGIVATAPLSVAMAIVGGLVGGALGYGGRVAAAIPRGTHADDIDPFAVNEPWRHAVVDAKVAVKRFAEATRNFKDGPLQDSVKGLGTRLDDAVQECWRIAKQGQALADARRGIDDREIRSELERQAKLIPTGGAANATQERTIAYGKQADQDTLTDIAQATNAAAYDASNPETITKVFTAVLSNF